jgi:aryl-alcohol dehydrogenase-like predicted oxidoreductase
LTKETTFPEGDFRRGYFTPENLRASIDRAEALRPLVPDSSTLAELALRFILSDPRVSTVIPGMRKLQNVGANIASSDAGPLDENLLAELRRHRWVRKTAP